jgi:hypothetical protein
LIYLIELQGQKDDKYIVLVVDQFGGRGNVLNFNVGDGVKFALPNVFWTRLSGKYGTVSQSKCYGDSFSILPNKACLSPSYTRNIVDLLCEREWY